MLDKSIHKAVLINILKNIYTEPQLRPLLGFKGGSAAFIFYNLPRFSVDLDFDLLQEDKKELLLKKLSVTLKQFGKLQQSLEKHYTIFFLLNYKKGQHNIKIEISKRQTAAEFEVKQFLGISMLVMKQEDLAATKLAALLTRTHFASRDLFDLWFYLKNNWRINEKTLKINTNLSIKSAINAAIKKVNNIHKNQLLQGLGELVDEKQKSWVKETLKEELLFQLKLYLEALKP